MAMKPAAAPKFVNLSVVCGAAEKRSKAGKPAGIGAFNINFYSQAVGVLKGLKKANAPAIIQASKGANEFQGGPDKIAAMLKLAMQNTGHNLPICLHLDHGDEKQAQVCTDSGFSSVMIDASKLDFEDNCRVTKSIVTYARPKGVSVEGEYGKLEGVEEDVAHEKTTYADPSRVVEFFQKTDAEALAVAYGTAHGANKGKNIGAVKTEIVKASYDAMKKAGQTDKHFLVGHGSSTVPQDLVKEINSYGGALKDSAGVPMPKIKEGIAFGLRKVNIDTDLRLSITATMRKYLSSNPAMVQKYPETLGRIAKAFSGEIQMIAKGKVEDPKKVIDPRGYFGIIDIAVLRVAPTPESGLVEVMALIENRIADHVAMLVTEFGCAGLASEM
ncbi:MAG: class II fructose-bisphosphate aldolase [Planctomycetota bacterium]